MRASQSLSRPRRLVIPALLVLASGCGGGGDSSSGPDGGPTTEGVRLHGTISGLKGGDAVLQLNGANDQTLQSAWTDFFFTNVPKKSTYAITVKAQPTFPWQTCVLGNATGTANADVENITLTCTTNTYAVKGSVSGLTGTGLTLQLNGANPQSLAAGATTFSFPGVASQAPYAITVSAQPVGQTCAINNSVGAVQGADVTNLTITCGAPGITIGGSISGLGGDGLTLRLNGGAPLAVAALAEAFTFPNALPTGTDYSVVVATNPRAPLRTCSLARAKGRVATANVVDIGINCRGNATLEAYEGTYVAVVNGRRNYLTLWSSGNFSSAIRDEDPTCLNNGNGTEYGAYKRATDGTFSILVAYTDRNGGCGVWDSQATPAVGLSGKLVRNGNQLTLTFSGGTVVLDAVANVATGLVGSFTRADGIDGSFVIFEPDGTYLYNEAQDATSTGNLAGYERGCYALSGATFTISLAATCRPSGQSAIDLNNRAGFSASNGAPIPFAITSETTATIGGVEYRRLLPGG
ncbi:MAG: hypothetical protein IPP90_03750 [Gemmatimonadaceae bacterium]|nr:hypothetical protein [Gemmatimonadaceae bacterium]